MDIINKAARYFRGKQIPTPKDVHATLIAPGHRSYQLFFPSCGCRHACTMCSYGVDHPIDENKVLNQLETIPFPENIKELVLEASGSFLDDKEVPEELQKKILQFAKNKVDGVINIETHYSTVTDEKIEFITEILEGHDIVFEFGFESANPEVQAIYNKPINLEEFSSTSWKAHEAGISTEVNILFGAPLLTPMEQISDCLNSIDWTFKNLPSDVNCVLFPINIKRDTLVRHMYEQNRYNPVSQWEFIHMLDLIPLEYLDRIALAWTRKHGKCI